MALSSLESRKDQNLEAIGFVWMVRIENVQEAFRGLFRSPPRWGKGNEHFLCLCRFLAAKMSINLGNGRGDLREGKRIALYAPEANTHLTVAVATLQGNRGLALQPPMVSEADFDGDLFGSVSRRIRKSNSDGGEGTGGEIRRQ